MNVFMIQHSPGDGVTTMTSAQGSSVVAAWAGGKYFCFLFVETKFICFRLFVLDMIVGVNGYRRRRFEHI